MSARPWPADLPPMHVLSLMSGTSVDGTDGVLARFEQVGGVLAWDVLDRTTFDFDPELRRRLLRAIEPGGADAVELTQLHAEVGEAYADLCADVAAHHRVELIGLSGQTIYHIPRLEPERGWRAISTLQVGEPSRVLERLRVPVVSDFRQSDLAAGGQGAPMVPFGDLKLFGAPGVARAVQNLGGIGNVTWLPADGDPDRVLAFDTGPANCLIDEAVAATTGAAFDAGGRLAAAGRVDDALLARLLDALASVREANVARSAGAPGRPPPPGRADLRAGEDEAERFSPDGDWMPRVVMVAKSTYVWLEQLARDHGVRVERLDEVPDAALSALASRGVNALWLIGVWQRSEASRRIKHLRGQHDAVASAYALHDYAIADDLGGEAAFQVLKARAGRHGIRMATDMVPNHVGIDGRWVIEHPERFVQLPHPPYPGYTFTGPDLSSDPRVEIRIEDHYYDGSDAAVVFERRDTATGQVRYVYHGNDGTAMPWNDTAQLDYLQAEVREAVLRTIVEVARRSPIIRFDAAMTLAKRHVRRLWFPPPGEGGGVPSRGRFGAMTDEAFEAAMGGEFWRAVVERVAHEVPDTLLLAEAFWMMESYFVRSLGMHRVYNSAFMHMMRDQDNAGYRGILKELLEFDPRVLQRYVNFMNNPDEESAREQFGDGDRYFAVATLLATMPGLPMIGHGQFEGYREKYGMEFRRAKLDERPEGWLIDRHDRDLVPILRRRAAFAGAAAFRLFDAVADDGAILEDVYAFANDVDGHRSLVLVNHRYPRSTGSAHRSVPFVPHSGAPLRTVTVGEALGLVGGAGRYVVARDLARGVTVVRSSDEALQGGWRFDLDGYARRVYVDVQERVDPDGSLARIAAEFGDRGVPSLSDAVDEWRWGGAYAALDAAATALLDGAPLAPTWQAFALAVAERTQTNGAVVAAAPPKAPKAGALRRTLERSGPAAVVAAAYAHLVGHLADASGTWRRARFGRPLARRLTAHGHDAATWEAAAVAALGAVDRPEPPDVAAVVVAWRRDDAARAALGVHEHEGVVWFRAEGVAALADVLEVLGRWARPGGGSASAWRAWRARLDALVAASGYRVDAWLEAAGADGAGSRAPAEVEGRAKGKTKGKAKRKAKGVNQDEAKTRSVEKVQGKKPKKDKADANAKKNKDEAKRAKDEAKRTKDQAKRTKDEAKPKKAKSKRKKPPKRTDAEATPESED
ncbi:MAG: anhydro-N-acetylmuramic acid kinase [Trueperaceae bacterium]|nr:anhydro-N-acetylmuramic acid kinase [Trueperaceae bacterium]